MIPILANADIQQRLVQFLPEGEVLPKSEEELRATVSSPQFKQVWFYSFFYFVLVFILLPHNPNS